MKKLILKLSGIIAALMLSVAPASAQFDFGRILSGGVKLLQAATVTDAQMANYVREYVQYMDQQNPVLPASSPYVIRLDSLTRGLDSVEGIPLNFKVYKVADVNAFACADGSVRVFSSLMDIMSDEELLGVIGHELGHVAHHDSKKAFQHALLTSALKDGIASTSSTAAALTDSQLGALGEALSSASYSKKQESQADDYGYEFLKSHGRNPYAMVLSFQRLKQIQGHQGGHSNGLNQLFSSHPDLDKRIKRMQQRAKKDGFIK